ncbi:MAG TPA: hypothetical protein VKM94_26445 [Blastocatellia bacterium]|nr:hypothetical protein [Blastocatellia bacterium]
MAVDEVVYNIPINLLARYRRRKVIVRSYDAQEIVAGLSNGNMDDLVAVQLLSLNGDGEVLTNWGYGVPVDLVMLYPTNEFPSLYRYARLLDRHPLRVCIPVVNGFSKAVKVAASLKLLIKLEIGQPDPSLMEEVLRVLNFYIHSRAVALPIEYFHSTFLAKYHSEQSSLWDVQEENPATLRYVTEDGRETIARRLGNGRTPGDLTSFVPDLQNALFVDRAECYECPHFQNCGGYFKWPSRNYRCDGVKSLFKAIDEAAREMRDSLNVMTGAQKGVA